MFMWFCGGGVGHKVMWEWDQFLQSNGAPANVPEDEENWDDVDMDAEDGEEDREEDREEDNDKEGVEDRQEDREEDKEEDPDDKVEADSDEELDDDVLAQEGYGTL
jgi:hypothetical protein